MTNRDAYEVLQVHHAAHPVVLQAAYRVLAALYHPDRDPSPAATHKMTELNIAYAKVRTRDLRELYDRERNRRPASATPTVTQYRPADRPTQAPPSAPDLISFGRYSGWSIKQLAPRPGLPALAQPALLRIRYRGQIEAAMAPDIRKPPRTPARRRYGAFARGCRLSRCRTGYGA